MKNFDDDKDKKNNLTPCVFMPSNSISRIWSSKKQKYDEQGSNKTSSWKSIFKSYKYQI